ncbi:MAG: HD domain-containing protein [Clostridium sp.]|nr:HD domain-containing protein [Clostridium sp.]
MLTIQQANEQLQTAYQKNPGPWVEHSRSVAENARRIAEHTDCIDPDTAYTMGLLHDIGRAAGVSGIRHIFDGYDRMIALGQPTIARICLTHSFPLKNIHAFQGSFDCSKQQLAFLQCFLDSCSYDNYDRLIQLCDALSLPSGACILEKRLVDVALRHGVNDLSLEKWRAFLQLKQHFDRLCRCNLYTLLPNVLENSSVDLI